MNIDFELVKQQAEQELYDEKFKEAVENEKERIRNKKCFWDFIPYKILIVKK